MYTLVFYLVAHKIVLYFTRFNFRQKCKKNKITLLWSCYCAAKFLSVSNTWDFGTL